LTPGKDFVISFISRRGEIIVVDQKH